MTSLLDRLRQRQAAVPLTRSSRDLLVEIERRDRLAGDSLPAVLNLIEAAQYARKQSQQLIGMDDPFGSQGPPILIGANAWFELADAVAVFVTPEGDRSTMSGQEDERRSP